jgi:hypothetical protein
MIAVADEPRPRPKGTEFVTWIASFGRRRCGAHMVWHAIADFQIMLLSSHATSLAPSPSYVNVVEELLGAASARSFIHMSSAAPKASNPQPRLAVVAGTVIVRTRRPCARTTRETPYNTPPAATAATAPAATDSGEWEAIEDTSFIAERSVAVPTSAAVRSLSILAVSHRTRDDTGLFVSLEIRIHDRAGSHKKQTIPSFVPQ